MKIYDLVKKKKHLFWSTKNYDGLSEDIIVENFVNYGDMDDINQMIDILGIKKVNRIFQKQIKRERNNYYPQVKNYFKLFFKKYA